MYSMGEHVSAMNPRKVICALDTHELDVATQAVRQLCDHVGAFKIGHALTLNYGLDIVDRLRDAGAKRIFLDLKFHDIPNSVALAVREAARRGVWMITLHTVGGPAMIGAAVEEAQCCPEEGRPLLVGVNVLTSVNQQVLTDHIGVNRTVSEQMAHLSQCAMDFGMDGVVCSPEEVRELRATLPHDCVIVTPGIRRQDQATGGHERMGTAESAIEDGADYLVIGRGLMSAPDPVAALVAFGLKSPSNA